MVNLSKEELRSLIRETVHESLTQMGFDVEKPLEVQADLRMLREWRSTSKSVRKTVVFMVLGAIVSGAVAAFWAGLKIFMKGGE